MGIEKGRHSISERRRLPVGIFPHRPRFFHSNSPDESIAPLAPPNLHVFESVTYVDRATETEEPYTTRSESWNMARDAANRSAKYRGLYVSTPEISTAPVNKPVITTNPKTTWEMARYLEDMSRTRKVLRGIHRVGNYIKEAFTHFEPLKPDTPSPYEINERQRFEEDLRRVIDNE